MELARIVLVMYDGRYCLSTGDKANQALWLIVFYPVNLSLLLNHPTEQFPE